MPRAAGFTQHALSLTHARTLASGAALLSVRNERERPVVIQRGRHQADDASGMLGLTSGNAFAGQSPTDHIQAHGADHHRPRYSIRREYTTHGGIEHERWQPSSYCFIGLIIAQTRP